MNDYIEEAQEEIKRVDHIIHVSLKYTRTVDILRNALNRIINACDWLVEALIDKAIYDKKIKSAPKSFKLKCDLVNKVYEDEKISELVRFYLFIRNIYKARYSRVKEYRRPVAMIAHLESGDYTVNIDLLEDELEIKLREYFDYVKNILEGEEDGE